MLLYPKAIRNIVFHTSKGEGRARFKQLFTPIASYSLYDINKVKRDMERTFKKINRKIRRRRFWEEFSSKKHFRIAY